MSKIEVEQDGKRIRLTGWAGPNTPKLCKSVGGGRFSKVGGPHWTFPLDFATCKALRSAFGSSLSVGPALNVWARAEKARLAALSALVAADDDTIETPKISERAPKIAAAMSTRTYQRKAAMFGASAGSFGLFDQPGLGKTIETLGTIIESDDETSEQEHRYHLIFCPKVAVKDVWLPEITKWLGDDAMAFSLLGPMPKRAEALENALTYAGSARHIFIVTNIETVRRKPDPDDDKKTTPVLPGLFGRNWDTIVVDESHRALIRTKGKPTQVRSGFTALTTTRRIALSGTPMRGKPEQLWGTLNWLRPDLYTSYWNWVGRYFNLVSNGFSNYVLAGLRDNAEAEIQRDTADITLRRTKAEALPELPAKQYGGHRIDPDDEHSPIGVWLDLEGAHAKQYNAFIKDSALDFPSGESIMANGALAEYTRQKQLANAVHKMVDGKLTPTTDSPKFEWLLAKCDELGIRGNGEDDGDDKIVVASQFTALINVFAKEFRSLGIPCHVLTGETSDNKRSEIIRDFQSDESTARVFFLNTKAGGVAVTLDAADTLVIIDETTVPDDQEQVEDRIHRTSRIHAVVVYYLRTRGTLDEEISWAAASRESVQKYLLDGARGIDYAKSLYRNSRATISCPVR